MVCSWLVSWTSHPLAICLWEVQRKIWKTCYTHTFPSQILSFAPMSHVFKRNRKMVEAMPAHSGDFERILSFQWQVSLQEVSFPCGQSVLPVAWGRGRWTRHHLFLPACLLWTLSGFSDWPDQRAKVGGEWPACPLCLDSLNFSTEASVPGHHSVLHTQGRWTSQGSWDQTTRFLVIRSLRQ